MDRVENRSNARPYWLHRTPETCHVGLLCEFGSDFTKTEQRLIPALEALKAASSARLAALLLHGLASDAADADCLDRMGLARPKNPREWLYAALLRGALTSA